MLSYDILYSSFRLFRHVGIIDSPATLVKQKIKPRYAGLLGRRFLKNLNFLMVCNGGLKTYDNLPWELGAF